MPRSINTNAEAMIAFQNLTKTATALDATQLRITTGLKINGPRDDEATFSITQSMRGDIAGIQTVKSALAAGESKTNVAISAGKALAEILTEMRAKVEHTNQWASTPRRVRPFTATLYPRANSSPPSS